MVLRARLWAVLAAEVPRSRARVAAVRRRFPAADVREVARHLVSRKRRLALLAGGATGMLGALSVPPSVLLNAWLELSLLSDVAAAYGLDARRDSVAEELVGLFRVLRGVPLLKREGARLLGPLGAPLGAWLAGAHLERVGHAAVRHFEGFRRLEARGARGQA